MSRRLQVETEALSVQTVNPWQKKEETESIQLDGVVTASLLETLSDSTHGLACAFANAAHCVASRVAHLTDCVANLTDGLVRRVADLIHSLVGGVGHLFCRQSVGHVLMSELLFR